MESRRHVHPLLLEPTYWRHRLEKLDSSRPSVLVTPRPDLCAGGRDVVEFRIRAHDGQALWGLLARPTLRAGPWPARIRSVGPATRPEIDRAWIEAGSAEFVFQEQAGRRLEDRVLDVVHVGRLAIHTEGIDKLQLSFASLGNGPAPDELLIAGQLFISKFC